MKLFNETKKGYRYNKVIIWVALLIVFANIYYVMKLNSFDFSTKIYFNCEDDQCENPLFNMNKCSSQLKVLWVIPVYETVDCKETCIEWWCDKEFVPRGEYGEKPPANIGYVLPFSFIIIILALVLNHIFFNKGKKFDLEIRITDKVRINIDDIKKVGKETINETLNKNDKDNS